MGGTGRGRGGGGAGGSGRRRRTDQASRDERQQQQQDGQQGVPVSPLLRLSMSKQTGEEKDKTPTHTAPAAPAVSSAPSAETEDGEIAERKGEDDAMPASQAKRRKMVGVSAVISTSAASNIAKSGSSLLICHPTSTTDAGMNAQLSKNNSTNGSGIPMVRLDEPDWLVRHPPNLRRLVRAAADRHTNLLLMPKGMTRRQENTTTHSSKQDVINWRIEWKFHLEVAPKTEGGPNSVRGRADGVTRSTCANGTETNPAVVTITVDGIPESTSLSDILSAQLDVKPDGKNRAARSKLRALASLPRESLHILTKSLPCPASKPLYVELQPDQNLTEALKGLTIVEFPVLEVAAEQYLGLFPRKIEVM